MAGRRPCASSGHVSVSFVLAVARTKHSLASLTLRYNSPADFANVAPYGKSFNAPYRFVITAITLSPYAPGVALSILESQSFSASTAGRTNGVDYVQFAIPSTTMSITFVSTETLIGVRFHAQLSAETSFTFRNAAGENVCSPASITAVNEIDGTWQWFELNCVPLYFNYNFQFYFPREYISQCTGIG